MDWGIALKSSNAYYRRLVKKRSARSVADLCSSGPDFVRDEGADILNHAAICKNLPFIYRERRRRLQCRICHVSVTSGHLDIGNRPMAAGAYNQPLDIALIV